MLAPDVLWVPHWWLVGPKRTLHHPPRSEVNIRPKTSSGARFREVPHRLHYVSNGDYYGRANINGKFIQARVRPF
jgi:hypothetical protein